MSILGQTFGDNSDVAAAGNGGTADASADGGAVSIGDVNSGGNTGSGIAAGDNWDGATAIDGGDVSNSTSLGISADGGTAISDASGGDDNFAFVS
jgi:hypothetical protein